MFRGAPSLVFVLCVACTALEAGGGPRPDGSVRDASGLDAGPDAARAERDGATPPDAPTADAGSDAGPAPDAGIDAGGICGMGVFTPCMDVMDCAGMPGDCADAMCLPEPAMMVPVCCLGGGRACVDDTGCCGNMACVAGRCACQPDGRPCFDHVECCNGVCSAGNCGP